MNLQSWVSAAPAIIAAAALVTLPGLPIAVILRLRRLTLLAASIAASFAYIAISSILTPLVGLPWSVLPYLATATIVTLAALALRPLLKVCSREVRPIGLPFIAGAIVVAGGIATVLVARGIGDATNVSQTYDGLFHLNAVTQILSNADASPFHLNLAYPLQEVTFYPSVWHATVALIAQLTGAAVPVATNALVLTVSAWVWPVAMLFLSERVFVRRPQHLFVAAVLIVSFSAFPYLLIAWGVLYPNLLSTALLPVAFGFFLLALRTTRHSQGVPLVSAWIVTAGAIGAASLAHPNAVFGLAVLIVVPLIQATIRILRGNRATPQKVWLVASIIFILLSFVVLWVVIGTSDNSRTYEGSIFRALASGVGNAPLLNSHAWFLTALVALGAVTLFMMRVRLWLIGTYVVSLALYVVSSGMDGSVRDLLTGVWYNDAHRLAALLTVPAILLAGVAATALFDSIQVGIERFARKTGKSRGYAWPQIYGVGFIVLLFIGANGVAIQEQATWIRHVHMEHERSPILSADEFKLLDRLDETVPEGALIAGNPWTGTAYAMTLSDRDVLFPHFKGDYGEAASTIASDFGTLGVAACSKLESLNVNYMLEFAGPIYRSSVSSGPDHFTGLNGLSSSTLLTEVDREGAAVLYKVTGCKQTRE